MDTPVAGQYKISATFAGDDSYGNSFATTYSTVSQAQSSPTAASLQSATDYTMTILGGIVAVIIAVVLVGAILAMMIRKKA
jgi:hypothetical protein